MCDLLTMTANENQEIPVRIQSTTIPDMSPDSREKYACRCVCYGNR